jgi:putative acetyltransferase
MVVGPDVIREARPDDREEIDTLLKAAFGRPDEAELVRRLRADGDIWFERVMRWHGVIAGYAALSRMRSPERWACLAPIADLPRMQNGAAAPNESTRSYYAIGTRLAGAIAMISKEYSRIEAIEMKLPATIVVVGKPSFFERAGFSSARAQKLVTSYPTELTLIARPGNDIPSETLVYPPAFDGLE